MKFLLLTLSLTASLVFGQQAAPKKLTGRNAEQAMEIAANPGRTKPASSISGAAIIRIPGINGKGDSFNFLFMEGGTHVFTALFCDGTAMTLGTYELYGTGRPGTLSLLNVDALYQAIPGITPICQIIATRINGGSLEQLTAEPGDKTGDPVFNVAGEGVSGGGGYYLYMNGLTEKPTVVMGNYNLPTRIERAPDTNYFFVYFDDEVNGTPLGPTTITVCQKNRCGTQLFERRIIAPTTTRQKG